MAAYERELEVAQRLAVEAGELILEVYGTSFAVTEKDDDKGPVTEADRRANEHIVRGLRAAFPTDSIIAEETERRDETGSSRAWFVDPLDGTQEFVGRNGQFAVHVGLAVEGAPVAGVVYAPVSRKVYRGAVGHGAFLEVDGEARALALRERPDTSDLHLVVSRSHRSPRTEAIMRALGISQVAEQGSVGLKVGLILEGKADLYLHPMPRSSRWDTCAPEAVLRAAGGVLTDLSGAAYRYDGVELENVRGIVACSVPVYLAVMPRLRELLASGEIPRRPST